MITLPTINEFIF